LKATVKGREIGDGLISLLEGHDNRMTSAEIVLILESKTLGWQTDEARMARNDKVDTIKALAEECPTVGGIREKIKEIFDDNDKPGVLFSTIHKAKGCEWDRGFLIHPEQIPHKLAKTPEALEQERNLDYVWRTRFRKERYTVV
jgi:superfamily I DNA/RNA helicase